MQQNKACDVLEIMVIFKKKASVYINSSFTTCLEFV